MTCRLVYAACWKRPGPSDDPKACCRAVGRAAPRAADVDTLPPYELDPILERVERDWGVPVPGCGLDVEPCGG